MSKKSKQRVHQSTFLRAEPPEQSLEPLPAQDLDLLFEEADRAASGSVNFPIVAGMSLITLGFMHVLASLGLLAWPGPGWATAFTILGAALVLLLGISPAAKKRKKQSKRRRTKPSKSDSVFSSASPAFKLNRSAIVSAPDKRKLRRSSNQKVMGVAGGLAEYFKFDPTLMRLATLVIVVASFPAGLIGYFILGGVMAEPEDVI